MRFLSAKSKETQGSPSSFHSTLYRLVVVNCYTAVTKVQRVNQVWQRHSVVVSGVGLINEVNRHWARLVFGWVTVSIM